jgi:hypothetical protein
MFVLTINGCFRLTYDRNESTKIRILLPGGKSSSDLNKYQNETEAIYKQGSKKVLFDE